ncbi:MAG: L-fucose isomerase, partial [Phocaeicola sp.]|nr:L-fucose isomerase [Phocaeicola sp.]
VAMGIAGSYCNADLFQKYFGIRAEWVDMTEIVRRITLEIYDHDEYEKALGWVKENCREGFDCNEGKDLPEIIRKSKVVSPDKEWEFITKMTLVMRDILYGNKKLDEMGWHEDALGKNAIAGGFQGQRQWTDWKPNGDFTESLLNTTFDWNGPREPMILATENDSLNGTAMLLGHVLTNLPQIFSDVRTYWSPEAVKRVTGKELTGTAAPGIIHLINSGATTLDGTGQSKDKEGRPVMKPFWEMTDEDVKNCLKASSWMPADRDYFRGGGFSIHFLSKGEWPATMMRVNIVKGLGPVLQLAEGWIVDIDPEIHEILDKRTDPTWPSTWFTPRLDPTKDAFKDVYSVMNNWGANHGAITYGHIGADLITLASMLRIPVCMHNVAEDKIFRPAAWNAFGMDKEGADFRACATYGPIYK